MLDSPNCAHPISPIVCHITQRLRGLQEVWEGPGARVFRPQTIAVLPPMASQYDSAREDIQDVLVGALNRQGNIERVVSPEKCHGYLSGLQRSV